MNERLSSRSRRIVTLCACLIACAAVLPPARVHADAQGAGLKTSFAIDDHDPESQVPTPEEAMRAPLEMGYWVMLVSDRAEAATQRNDHAAAVRYYRAIAKATPDRAAGFKRMCTAYQRMGDWQNAVGSCQVALEKQGATLGDYASYVRVLLTKTTALEPSEITDADAVIAHMQSELAKAPASADTQILIEHLRCEIGTRLEDPKRLAGCVTALRKLAPEDPSAVTFAFALALMERDFDGARSLIGGAQKAGVPESGVALMNERLAVEVARTSLWARAASSRAPLLAACLAALVALGLLARRRLGILRSTT